MAELAQQPGQQIRHWLLVVDDEDTAGWLRIGRIAGAIAGRAAKLLAALGVWLGPTMLLPILIGASVLGTVVGVAMKASGALREGRYVPFGPFLAGAGIAVFLIGAPTITDWLGWY